MKASEKILKYLMFAFIVASIAYLAISIFEFMNSDIRYSPELFYNSVTKYSELHSFTLAIVATYLGLKRLRLSHESHEKTLSQLNLSEQEIERRKQVEINEETLKRCEYYLTEIQTAYKQLIQTEQYSGIPIIWSRLTSIDRNSLEQDYKSAHDKIQNSEKELKSQSLILLYKLDAFSASFLFGNTDIELGHQMIGNTFCKQVGFLVGLIAYYRPKGSEHLFKNTLSLMDEWSEKRI